MAGVVAIAVAAVFLAVRFHLSDNTDRAWFLAATAAVLMSLWGGLGLGLLFTISMGLCIDYFAIPEVGHILDSEESVAFFVITLIAAVVGALVGTLRLSLERTYAAKGEAERAVKARDEMVGIISHELKNPLTAIQSGMELMQKTVSVPPGNPMTLKLIDRINPSIRRMTLLVSDLLDVTRLEAQALKLEPRDADLYEIATEVVRAFEAEAQEKLLELSLGTFPEEARPVRCDPTRTGQILSNLVGNSIKFTNAGGFVRISASKSLDQVEVHVSDSGKGIAKDYLPHVFERFWQSKDSAHQGAGLGLAISKGLVEPQGGRIRVESQPGVGTTFFFTIPAAPLATAAA